MTLQPRLPFAAALAALALIAAPAWAGVEHQPESGTPAFEIDVPDGYQLSRDGDGNLYLLANDHSGGIVLNIVAADGAGAMNLDELAAQSMTVAKAPPPSRQEPGQIGGVRGITYYSSIPADGGTVSVKLTLVKLDANHVASDAEIRSATITAAQSAAIDALAARVHFIR
jgi:hypothetical protein